MWIHLDLRVLGTTSRTVQLQTGSQRSSPSGVSRALLRFRLSPVIESRTPMDKAGDRQCEWGSSPTIRLRITRSLSDGEPRSHELLAGATRAPPCSACCDPSVPYSFSAYVRSPLVERAPAGHACCVARALCHLPHRRRRSVSASFACLRPLT